MISDDILDCIEIDLKEIAHRERRVLSVIKRFPDVLTGLKSQTDRSRRLVARLGRLIGPRSSDDIDSLVGESVLPQSLIEQIQHAKHHDQVSG